MGLSQALPSSKDCYCSACVAAMGFCSVLCGWLWKSHWDVAASSDALAGGVLPWLEAVWMSQQLWWLLRGVVDCGTCDVVLAHRLGCSRGPGRLLRLVAAAAAASSLLSGILNPPLPLPMGRRYLFHFLRVSVQGRSMGTLCYTWSRRGRLSTAVNLSPTCTDHLLGGMVLGAQQGESMQPNKMSAACLGVD